MIPNEMTVDFNVFSELMKNNELFVNDFYSRKKISGIFGFRKIITGKCLK